MSQVSQQTDIEELKRFVQLPSIKDLWERFLTFRVTQQSQFTSRQLQDIDEELKQLSSSAGEFIPTDLIIAYVTANELNKIDKLSKTELLR